jgi:hypothetical protein
MSDTLRGNRKLNKVLIALLIIVMLTLILGAIISMPAVKPPKHAMTFTLTSSNLVITNNGTMPLAPFNFTVYTSVTSDEIGFTPGPGTILTGCTNTTLAPNAQLSVLPGSYSIVNIAGDFYV